MCEAVGRRRVEDVSGRAIARPPGRLSLFGVACSLDFCERLVDERRVRFRVSSPAKWNRARESCVGVDVVLSKYQVRNNLQRSARTFQELTPVARTKRGSLASFILHSTITAGYYNDSNPPLRSSATNNRSHEACS